MKKLYWQTERRIRVSTYDDVNAICPFFLSGDKQRITCEGLIDRSRCINRFDYSKDREQYRSKYCDKHYEQCRIYRALNQKYEEEQDGKT